MTSRHWNNIAIDPATPRKTTNPEKLDESMQKMMMMMMKFNMNQNVKI